MPPSDYSHPLPSNVIRPLTPDLPPVALIEARDPQASDPQLPSLLCLSNETITAITDLLLETSPHTLSSLALVCCNFYRIARYSQHREVALVTDRNGVDNVTTEQLNCIEKRGMLQAIRRLEILGRHSETFVLRLHDLIPKMTGLAEVTWRSWQRGMIPASVIRLLKERPWIRLHTQASGFYPRGAGLTKMIGHLENNDNLTSLNVIYEYSKAVDCVRWTRPLKRVLLSCPNLRKLKLDVRLRRGGCVRFPAPRQYCGFGFVGEERPPALEVLELINYPFGHKSSTSNEVPPNPGRSYCCDGYPLDEPEEDYWSRVFDWSQLKVLKTDSIRFALQIMPQLMALEMFSCNWIYDDFIKTFYEHVPSVLQRIVIPTMSSIGIDVLLKHSSGLKELTIHQTEKYREMWGRIWRRDAIDANTLRKIRDTCPHIEELHLDIGRDGQWPYEILDILASFPSLRKLEIWFELGLENDMTLVQPYLTFAAAGHLFQYLHEHAPRGSTRLQKATFVSGSPPTIGSVLMLSQVYWPNRNKATFVCTKSDRDDEIGNGVFSVECTRLNQEQNEYLRKLIPGEEDPDCPYSHIPNFVLARDGPIRYDQWKTLSN